MTSLQRRHCWARTPLIYNNTVHGPVFATATSAGQSYALSRRRSTFGRDAPQPRRAQAHDRGQGAARRAVLAHRQRVRLHLQLGATRPVAPPPTSPPGCLPKRAAGRRSPPAHDRHRASTSGRAILSRSQHPHDVFGPGGLLLNWNNRSAPGFMHGDDEPYGSVQRVENFDRFPAAGAAHRRRRHHEPRRDRGRALARSGRSSAACCAPARRRVRATSRSSTCSTTGSIATRPASMPTTDTFYDEAGPVIMDAVWRPIANAVMSPVFGVAARRPQQRPQPQRPRGRVLRGQGSPHPARRPGRRALQPLVLRRRRR